MENKAKIKDLISKKDNIEEEIKQMYDVLASQGNVGMTEPLVDSEGFPRNDIDVYQVRISRNKISCLQNDHKNLMKQIEEELYSLHSKNKPEAADSSSDVPMVDVTITNTSSAFASINLVSSGSPADVAGLRVGDELIQFGSVNETNFQNLQSIATVVQHSEGKNVEVKIKREGNIQRLMLTPKKWSGRGLLGCNIVPI
uniref:26S proteasome non-ATPase regulatory subunit 9-like n=1 Tax=Styela clava TaxID=7725 RepID=UPI00193AACF9|nr:26S proteasome non-ATPase regulatory subunit 9-like [Styela clava]